MKNLTRILLLALITSFTFACKEKVDGKTSNTLSQNKPIEQESNENISFEDPRISNILNAYLELKDALVETNGEKAKTAGENLLSVLDISSNETLDKLKEEVEKVSETTDPQIQRVSFDLISVQVYDLVKSSTLTEGKLYKQYCPMAKNNEGAFWLSVSNEIRNPYFGDKMLKCGSVEEEI